MYLDLISQVEFVIANTVKKVMLGVTSSEDVTRDHRESMKHLYQ